MLAINNKLTCERLTIPDDIEAFAVTINSTKNKKLIFGIVYTFHTTHQMPTTVQFLTLYVPYRRATTLL